jgi:hypothetical protein
VIEHLGVVYGLPVDAARVAVGDEQVVDAAAMDLEVARDVQGRGSLEQIAATEVVPQVESVEFAGAIL